MACRWRSRTSSTSRGCRRAPTAARAPTAPPAEQRRRNRAGAEGAGRHRAGQGAHHGVRVLRSVAGAQSRTTSRIRPADRVPDRRPRWPAAWRRLRSGTQTVASVNRPAAYCGIAAFKPSTRSLSCFGITPLGPSYDTPGFYGWSVDDAVSPTRRWRRRSLRNASTAQSAKPDRVCILEDPHIVRCDPGDAERRSARSADAFARAGSCGRAASVADPVRAAVQDPALDHGLRGRARLKHLLDAAGGHRSARRSRALIQRGAGHRRPADISTSAARSTACAKCCSASWGPMSSCGRPRPQPRRKGLGWTGDPKYISPWTALGGPIVSVPAGFAGNGLPIGCILTSRPGTDAQMCALGPQIEPNGWLSTIGVNALSMRIKAALRVRFILNASKEDAMYGDARVLGRQRHNDVLQDARHGPSLPPSRPNRHSRALCAWREYPITRLHRENVS